MIKHDNLVINLRGMSDIFMIKMIIYVIIFIMKISHNKSLRDVSFLHDEK